MTTLTLTTIDHLIGRRLELAEQAMTIGETKLALRYMEQVDKLRVLAEQHTKAVIDELETLS